MPAPGIVEPERSESVVTETYVPPEVWTWNKDDGGPFASVNRPVSGATHEKELPVGRHPLQLYALGTPNGVKVTIMLEELLAADHAGAEYDARLIGISEVTSSGAASLRQIRTRRSLPSSIAADPSRFACSNRGRSWFT